MKSLNKTGNVGLRNIETLSLAINALEKK